MATDGLFAIGNKLARPCLYFSEAAQGEAVVGVWGGQLASRLAGKRRAHWVSVSCDWLREQGFPIEGWLSIYTSSAAESEWQAITTQEGHPPADAAGGVALAARAGVALPHLDAIEAYLGTTINALVQDGRIGREDVATYDKHWWANTFNMAWLTLGGWRIPWPEDEPDDDPLSREFYEGERSLLLRTFRDAEPWVEVWGGTNGYLEAIPRIT